MFARRNTRLRKWSLALLASMLVIVAVVAVGHIYLQQSIHSYAAQVDQGNADLKAQNLEDTQTKVQDLSNSLKLVVQALQREILFSKLLLQVGAVLPNGAILTNLSINKVQGGLDLQAAATDYQTATQVQVNLQDKNNKIFDKADIINIQCTGTKTSDPVKSQYPCAIQLRAQFAKNNSFSFINPTTGSTP
ncbi:MAG TPA: hypothetical protein VLE74_00065 [Candidatus Saccharimonadales bacterium]|nr:hypothetical protein [Candidatus Saccharimonadales bacterium]